MIAVQGLTKTYGGTTVLDGIDLSVPAGQIAAVVGPSGAGKSTLARCITLLEKPTAGTITVDGLELTSLSGARLRTARRQIGTVFQSANLLRRLTAAENIALPLRSLRLSPQEQRRTVGELLDRVGMRHRANHYPAQLSGGQRQRIGIARGLALRPAVLLADEATSGLDPEATASILSLLTDLRDDLGVTILVITHEMDVVRAVADIVCHLDHGRIAEQGPVAEVVRRSDSPLSRALLPLPPATRGEVAGAWRLRFTQEVPPTWPALIGQALGTDVALISGLVEEVARARVGRLLVHLDASLDPQQVIGAFTRLGIDAQPEALRDSLHEAIA